MLWHFMSKFNLNWHIYYTIWRDIILRYFNIKLIVKIVTVNEGIQIIQIMSLGENKICLQIL